MWTKEIDDLFWKDYFMELLLHTTFVRPYVAEAIKELKQHDNKIIFISSRDDSNLPPKSPYLMYEMTEKYLSNNQIYFDHLILTQNKEQILYKYDVDIMIEDNPDFFDLGIQKGIQLFCFDAPYNQNLKRQDITRIFSWYDLLNKILLIDRRVI